MKSAFPNRGKIVAIVDLKDTCPAEVIQAHYPRVMTERERAFGNYDAVDKHSGNVRHGWITEFIFRVPEPVPFTSKQGLVDVPEEVRTELKRQWRLAA